MHTFRSHPCIQEQITGMKKSTFSTKDGTLQKLHQLLTSMKRSALSRINGTVALVTHSLVAPSFFFFFLNSYTSFSPLSSTPPFSLPCPHSLSPAETKEIPQTCPCPPTLKAGRRCPSHTQTGCSICRHRFHAIFLPVM